MPEQPNGTVTLLFTDIEGSTRLLDRLGTDGYAEVLDLHRRLLREAFARHEGYEFGTEGDALFVAFARAGDALAAATDGQRALAEADWPEGNAVRVRMGLHTGDLRLDGANYVGINLHRVARIMSAGHGGQIVLSAATRALVDGELTDLGEHRLKDFDKPVALHQVGSERFAPLRTISNTNLPRPASTLVGRQNERDELSAMLQNGSRLITLTGPGGSGKTRLALEVASDLVPVFSDGVFWSDLSPLRDPDLVTETLAQTLGASGDLAEHVADRKLLLVLDNFEQVADAAPGLGRLLTACPRLRAIVTSRELLRIRGEVEYPVPPLAGAEAVELFCQRSGLERDTTIAELCRRLDNMPLALELAAARTRVLTPAQILERLARRLDLLKGGRDADPRQQTLRATIEWSHDLLDEEERRLFARLAVFVGGCTLEAAEQVADADLDVLQSLVDKSLLRRSGERFWMLETIRDYAQERLAASGEEALLRRKHALALVEYVEATQRELEAFSGDQATLLARIDAEHENTRAALEWARDTDEHEVLLRLVVAARFAWGKSGRPSELVQWLELAVERANEPARVRAAALISLASRISLAGDGTRAAALLADARELAERESDHDLMFEVMNTAAWLASDAGDNEGAGMQFRAMSEQALELDDIENFAIATENLAFTLAVARDYGAAREQALKALDAFRTSHDDGGVAVALESCGWYSLGASDPVRATAYFLEALEVAHRLGARRGMADIAAGLGASLVAQHREEEGTRLMAAAVFAAAQLEHELDSSGMEIRDGAVRNAKLALGEGPFAAAWAEGEAMTVERALEAAGFLQQAASQA